jgi:acetyl esterase/lipase
VSRDPRDVLSRPAPPPDLTVSYGDLPEQVVDVRLPAETDHPPVIFLHGGFWRAEWDRTHAGPLAADLAAAGWPVAVVEYRRVGHAGGGWPGTFDDVAAGVAAAPAAVDRALAARGRPPSPPGAVLMGHSAGGQLALVYAGGAAARRLRGVLALAPVADLAEAHALDLDGGAVAALLGGGPADVPAHYAAADPVGCPPRVPTVVLHGDRDAQVPVTLSRRYATAARAVGGDVTLRELAGVEHFGLIAPFSTAWPFVTAQLQTLSRRSFDSDAG